MVVAMPTSKDKTPKPKRGNSKLGCGDEGGDGNNTMLLHDDSHKKDNSSIDEKGLIDRFTMGMVHTLEGMDHVADILVEPVAPCSSTDITKWEMKNTLKLPQDLKAFFRSSDGVGIAWTCVVGNEVLPVGHLHIHPLTKVKKVVEPKLPEGLGIYFRSTTVAQGLQTTNQMRRHLPFPAVELARCGSDAVVALVFTDPHPTVWLRDRSHAWHMLARNFTEYYRLMTLHLGVIGWQYSLTSLGPLPSTQSWLRMFAPHRILSEDEWENYHKAIEKLSPAYIEQHTEQTTTTTPSSTNDVVNSNSRSSSSRKSNQPETSSELLTMTNLVAIHDMGNPFHPHQTLSSNSGLYFSGNSNDRGGSTNSGNNSSQAFSSQSARTPIPPSLKTTSSSKRDHLRRRRSNDVGTSLVNKLGNRRRGSIGHKPGGPGKSSHYKKTSQALQQPLTTPPLSLPSQQLQPHDTHNSRINLHTIMSPFNESTLSHTENSKETPISSNRMRRQKM
eukprot:m.242111 g.242111  ORF g.242111 m.242111 type:complete len:500 (-) comp29860_c0_seq1:113-1612(-)